MKIKLPDFVENILETFEKNNFEIYLVGGAVRDLLLKRPVADWDFTTNATPPQIITLFPNSFYDNKFGTVGIKNPQEQKKKIYYGKPPIYEITTFRKEIGYSDRRHPNHIIWGKTIEDDLVRRDFTINAMALKPLGKWGESPREFELIDYFGGQKDLENKLIRAVGDPNKRFQEDALRMMRAIRIATQLRFNIEEKTFQAIKKNINLLDYVSNERIRDELLKLFSYKYSADGYLIMRNSGLAKKILPEAEKMFGVEQKSIKRHHQDDVGTHAIKSLRASRSSNPIVNLAIFLHDIGKPITFYKNEEGIITFHNHEVVGASIAKQITRRLRFSKKDEDKLFKLIRWHQFSVDERQTDKAIKRFIRNVGKENLTDILELRRADRVGGGCKDTSWRLERFKKKLIEVQKQPFTVNDLKVNGYDVMKILGIPPGPIVGKVLHFLFEEVEKNRTRNKKEYLLRRIREIGRKLKIS